MTFPYRLVFAALILSALLASCTIKAPWDIKPKNYLDYASEAIERHAWEAAYRLLEDSLVSNDPNTRDRAYTLVKQHPLISQGAKESFSVDRLTEINRINDHVAWSIEKSRLARYQSTIATPAEYEQAVLNYTLVFGKPPSAMPDDGIAILPARMLDPPLIPCGATNNISVRLGHAQEPKAPRRNKGYASTEFIGANLGIVVISVAMAVPTWGGSLVIGGLALGTEAVIIVGMEALEKAERDAIVQAFRDTDIVAMTEKALRQHYSDRNITTHDADCRTEFVIDHYGIENDGCFMVDVSLLLFQRGDEVYRNRLLISRQQRSEDAPEALCASWKDYSSKSGQLVGETAENYAKSLASMISRRFGW